MSETVFLGLGSNRDNRLWYLFQTLRFFSRTPFLEIVKLSSIYETEPYGVADQRDFLNMVVEVQTNFSPGKLLQLIKFIEKKVGRIDRGFWASREIDIDILAYRERVTQFPWLHIPHKEVQKRRFVLEPFAEIAAGFIVPQIDYTVRELLEACPDTGRVTKIISNVQLSEQLLLISAQEGVFN